MVDKVKILTPFKANHLNPRAMNALRDDENVTYFRVPLSDPSVALLMELAEFCRVPPAKVLASLVHDSLQQAKCEHFPEIVKVRASMH